LTRSSALGAEKGVKNGVGAEKGVKHRVGMAAAARGTGDGLPERQLGTD